MTTKNSIEEELFKEFKYPEILKPFEFIPADVVDFYADQVKTLLSEILPEWKPAHTYSSENADVYRAYDQGFKDAISEIKEQIKLRGF